MDQMPTSVPKSHRMTRAWIEIAREGSDRHLEFCRYNPSDWGSQSSSWYTLSFLGLSQQGAMHRGTAAFCFYHFFFSGSLACAKSFAFYHDYMHITIRRAHDCLHGRDVSYFLCFAAGPTSCHHYAGTDLEIFGSSWEPGRIWNDKHVMKIGEAVHGKRFHACSRVGWVCHFPWTAFHLIDDDHFDMCMHAIFPFARSQQISVQHRFPRRYFNIPWDKLPRLGEAENPGPDLTKTLFYHTTINITKLRTSTDDVFELWSKFPGAISLVETSASLYCIQHVKKIANRHKLRFHSGSPCADRTDDASRNLRPLFGGVGCITGTASRAPECQTLLDEWESTRYQETILRFGHLQILVVTIYLHVRDDSWFLYRKDASEALLHRAQVRVSEWGGPAIIAGDFNQPPRETTIWPILQAKGWSEAHDFAEECLGTPTFPTYREDSKNDTALFSAELAGAVHSITVHRGHHFPQHKPITIAFHLHDVPASTKVWKIPKPLTKAQLSAIDKDKHDDHFVTAMCELDLDTQTPGSVSLESWSRTAETAINACLLEADCQGLSKGQWGRGKPPVYKMCPIKKESKFARQGDFAPPLGGTSVVAKQCTRQIRRLESIKRMLHKHGPVFLPTVNDDWQAVRRAKGFLPDFPQWSGQTLRDYPDVPQVTSLLSILDKHFKEIVLEDKRRNRDSWTRDLHDSWKQSGNKLAHQRSRKPKNPWLSSVKEQIKLVAQRVRSRCKGPPVYRVLRPEVEFAHVVLPDHCRWISQCDGTLAFKDAGECEQTVEIDAKIWHHSPAEAQHAFFGFWSTFWEGAPPPGGDLAELDIPAAWKIAPTCTLTLDGLKEAIVNTNTETAIGADGWRLQETSALGDVALACFVQIFNHYLHGQQPWPDTLQWARVVLPGKIAEPNQVKDGRPINILGLLYRLGMKCIAREVLLHLSFTLPPSIVGGLPKRDGAFLWYHTQYLIEKALTEDSPLFGCVTDLQKFFNGIPRMMLRTLMLRFGLPTAFVDSWIDLLNHLKRSVVIQGDHSLPRKATCGVPEGDPFSVAAAVMIGAQLHWAITKDATAQPLIYIDNIEIITKTETDMDIASEIALDFFHQWGFRLDQDKSWSWSTTPEKHLQHQPTFKSKRSAVNLGCAFNYKKFLCHGEYKLRLEEGLRRTKILASLPMPQEARMEAVAAGPYATAFYGSEGHYVGERPVAKLRRAVASIIAKPNKGLCPQIAMLAYKSGRLDPRIELIIRACRMARRACGNFPQRFADFWPLMKEGAKDHNKAYGPAKALGAYMTSLRITLHDDGMIELPEGRIMHFFRSCVLDLETMLLRCWELKSTQQLRARQGLETLGDLDLATTCKALRNIPERDAKLVRTYLAGGITTNKHAAHWQDITQACKLCGQPDTVAHRLCTCIATESVRIQQPVLQCLTQTEATSAWVIKPPGLRPPPADNFSVPTTLSKDDTPCNLYTDGSAFATKSAHFTSAGYAVVRDLLPGFGERTVTTSLLADPKSHFETICQERVPHRQSVPRAELLAIARALCVAKNVNIISDCKYALDTTEKLLHGATPAAWATKPNTDIVIHVHSALHAWPLESREIRLTKVKSHVSPQGSGTVAFHSYGNDSADAAAKAAARIDRGQPILQLPEDEEYWPKLYIGIAGALREYMHQLKIADKPSSKAVNQDPPREFDVSFHQRNPYFQWPDTDDWRTASPWGTTFNKHLMAWLGEISWPVSESPDIHVTWIELLVSFRLHSGLEIPVPDPKKGYYELYLTPGVHTIHAMPSRSLGAEAYSLRNAVSTLGKVLRQDLLPWQYGQAKCNTSHFGIHFKANGFRIRPDLPFLQKTHEILYRYFSSQKGKPATSRHLSLPSKQVCPEPEDLDFRAKLHRINYYRLVRGQG